MTQRTEMPSLTNEQMAILSRFARFDVGLEEVRRTLADVFVFSLDPENRSAKSSFRVPEPGILITKEHINRALEQKRLGLISERELVYWATLILMNEAYELDSVDEDFIADWLNEISYSLDATD
jgi:hypothetical protein